MKYIIKEIINEKKVNSILNKYNDIIVKNNNSTGKILLLVPNNKIKLNYDRNIDISYSESINTCTYLSFINSELVKYWPIVDIKCKKIKNHSIKPIFISNSLSDYIINNKVSKKRNLEGYFEDVTGSNRNIASSISYNINKAAQSLFDFKTIGERIYLSKKNRDKLVRFSYSQMDEIISSYIDLLISNSMIDSSISIYLYNKYLLNDEAYIKHLKSSIDYLIVDSLENCTSAEVDLINKIIDFTKESYLYINETKDYAAFNNVDQEYIKNQLFDKCEIIDNCNVGSIGINNLINLNTHIELNQNNQLYSEMISEVVQKIIKLVNQGYEPRDIAIICPLSNTIVDYQVKNILLKNNISLYSTKQDKRIIDYSYPHALMVATCIFYKCEELLNDEDYINFISLLLNTNKIKAFKIIKNKLENEEYRSIIDYIEEKRNININIHEFLMRFYIDKLLNLQGGKENVKVCKKIIQESENFTENIEKLKLNSEKTKEKIFIEALKSSIKDYYSVLELEELGQENSVVLTTPYTYIAHNMKTPIQIWIDIGSNLWSMKGEKEISNIHVLKKSFPIKQTYTDEIEDSYKRYYLFNTIYNLLLNTEQVYAYKSEYTVNGYIQESILYSLLLKLIDKGDFNEQD
ncbi:MAG: hypothetical protein ACRC1Y_06975 [Paraclostridium sp.]